MPSTDQRSQAVVTLNGRDGANIWNSVLPAVLWIHLHLSQQLCRDFTSTTSSTSCLAGLVGILMSGESGPLPQTQALGTDICKSACLLCLLCTLFSSFPPSKPGRRHHRSFSVLCPLCAHLPVRLSVCPSVFAFLSDSLSLPLFVYIVLDCLITNWYIFLGFPYPPFHGLVQPIRPCSSQKISRTFKTPGRTQTIHFIHSAFYRWNTRAVCVCMCVCACDIGAISCWPTSYHHPDITSVAQHWYHRRPGSTQP